MKVKELIKILETLDPESIIDIFTVEYQGGGDEDTIDTPAVCLMENDQVFITPSHSIQGLEYYEGPIKKTLGGAQA